MMRHETRTMATTSTDPLRALGLSTAQSALYTAVLRLHLARLPELAEAVDEPTDHVAAELETLVRLGVVDEQDGKFLARHPAAALGRLVADRLEQIAEESRQIDDVLGSIRKLTHHYDAGRDYRSGQFAVELVSGADVLYESVVGIALQAPPMDLISVIPDQRTVNDLVQKYAGPWIGAQRDRLISSRTILPVSSLTTPGVHETLTRLTEAGALIRTLDRLPSWYLTIGDDAAGLPAQWGGNLPDNAYNFYFVRSPIIVAVLRSLFEELWARAVPLSPGGRIEGTVQVLRLAAQGVPDELIARHLGISVRTVRSRFAEAMIELGAQSRFQAGVQAAHRGWLT
jgi:hypothetical protein